MSELMKQVVYVASPESKQIHVWSMDENGKLTLLQDLTLPGAVQPMQISRNGKHLYVGIRPNCSIITYRILAKGNLSQQAMTEIPATPTHIEIDKSGNWLFIASYHQGNLLVLPIDKNGIAQSPIQVIADLQYPHASGVSVDNQRLFVTCLGEDNIRIYAINHSGTLIEDIANKIATKKGAGPRHLAFNNNNNTFYCLNELDATIDVYHAYQPYKKVQNCAIVPAICSEIKPWAADIHLTPNSRHLYASERSARIIRHFQVTDSGQLSAREAYSTEHQPRGFNIDQTGNFLLVAGQLSDHLSIYTIDGFSGALKHLGRYPVGKGPMWIMTIYSPV